MKRSGSDLESKMTKPIKITIGAQTFDAHASARQYIRALLHSQPLLAPIDGPDHTFLLELLGKNPAPAEKIGVGVKRFTVEKAKHGSTCFYITHDDGSKVHFSFEKCITPTVPPKRS